MDHWRIKGTICMEEGRYTYKKGKYVRNMLNGGITCCIISLCTGDIHVWVTRMSTWKRTVQNRLIDAQEAVRVVGQTRLHERAQREVSHHRRRRRRTVKDKLVVRESKRHRERLLAEESVLNTWWDGQRLFYKSWSHRVFWASDLLSDRYYWWLPGWYP